MNGMRTNQFDAPTSFITSISRRRAKVASRIVFTIRNSDDASRTPAIDDEGAAGSSGSPSSRRLIWSCGVLTSSTPGIASNRAATAAVSSAFVGATRNDSGSVVGGRALDERGLVGEDPA